METNDFSTHTPYVSSLKLSGEFAIKVWTEETWEYHPGLFLLTMFLRVALGSVHGLREYFRRGESCTLLINGNNLNESVLFSKVHRSN